MEDVASNNVYANQTSFYEPTGLNISNVMPMILSPQLMASSLIMESSGPDDTNVRHSDLISKRHASLTHLEMNEMDDMLPFANNNGYNKLCLFLN